MAHTNQKPQQKNKLWMKIGILVGVAGILFGIYALAIASKSATYPGNNSVEAGFSRDMIRHHGQAVEMSFIIRESTDTEPIRNLAFDIINTQSVQIGMMRGWLEIWNLPATSTSQPMQWMSMEQMAAMRNAVTPARHDMVSNGPMMMPGMATDEQLSTLRTATSSEAEKLFLELMIAHHQGGVAMAQAVVESSDDTSVTGLAQTMVNGQQAEIQAMENMLSQL